jgi:hypothetical protein
VHLAAASFTTAVDIADPVLGLTEFAGKAIEQNLSMFFRRYMIREHQQEVSLAGMVAVGHDRFELQQFLYGCFVTLIFV